MSGESRDNRPLEKTRFWLDRQFGNLELLAATYITHSFSRHVHEGFAIGVIEAGAERFYYRGADHVAPAGSIVVINPGEIHTGHAVREDGWTYRMLYPGVELLERAAAEVSNRPVGTPFFKEPVLRDHHLFASLRRAHVSLEKSPSRLERESRLIWALSRFVSRHAERPSPEQPPVRERRAVRRAREYLEEHYARSVSLQDLSRVAGLSRFYLLRAFREEVGLPPHAYLVGVRVKRAKSLLLEDVPIARVAQQAGFFDQSHLTRHFKRLVGIPPGQYARGAVHRP